MNRRTFLTTAGAASTSAFLGRVTDGAAADEAKKGAARSRVVAAAAMAVLRLLNDAQRRAATYAFIRSGVATAAHFKGGLRGDVDMVGERYGDAVWSNFPVSDVPRPGLPMGALDRAQRAAVLDLLQAMLSPAGYRKVLEIMGSDQALADRGTPYASGRDAYTLAIFGQPDDTSPWMVQFGGHHLALNVAMASGRGVLAPVLTGCLPAIYTENGTSVRALSAENDKAFALLTSLDAPQREMATIDHPVSKLAQGPGHDGETIPPVGLVASAMSGDQQAMLYGLVLEWAALLNEDHAAPRLEEIRAGLPDTHFAWSGPATHEPNRNGASYFRVHGPDLFIEFSPQQPGGDPTMHVHTIYRDLSNAYGRAFSEGR